MGTLKQIVIAAFGFAVMTFAVSGGAHAACMTCVAALSDNNTISDGSWTATISDIVGNVPTGDELEVLSATGGTFEFELINSSNNSAVLTTSAGGSADLSFDVSVQSATRLRSVSAVLSGTTSSRSSSSLADINAGIGDGSGNINLTGSSSKDSGSMTFTPANPVTISYNLALNAPRGTTLSLNNLKTTVPEPATLVVLGPVVLALVKARKSKKRQLATPL